jgi:molybdate transport system ATP-binding protein
MLEFTARLAARGFDVSVEVATGETVAVLGPNGSGKSTLLDTIAGLARPDSGTARIDDRVLFDLGESSSGKWLAPHRRTVSLLAQKALLFPRMDVTTNVAFGPQSAGLGKRVAAQRAAHWLAEVGAADLATRKPSQLSGGQAQRVAIARALAAEPRLLLLDEPMAALDVTVTPSLRRLLRRVLASQTTILVTHDVLDAYTLADRVLVLNDGHVVEVGNTRDVFEHPRSPFTAALVGLNFLAGTRTRAGLRTEDGAEFSATGSGISVGASVGGTLPPASIRIGLSRPSGTGLNTGRATVSDIEPRGDLVRVNLGTMTADLAPFTVADLDLVPGTGVWFSFAASDLQLYEI